MDTALAPRTRYCNIIFDSARWAEIELRPGDIVISTPPKSGTTWMQVLCGLLVFDGPRFPAPLERLSPWVDMLDKPIAEVREVLEAQAHRRILKTHTPLDGLPMRDDVDYVVVGRDPRDVAVSFDHHMANFDVGRFLELRSGVVDPDEPLVLPAAPPADPVDRFRAFVAGGVDDGLLTLADVLRHLRVAWDRRQQANVHLIHYADLRRDLPGELLRLSCALGFSLTAARAEELAAEATIDRMRDRADEIAPGASRGFWHDTRRFIRTGGTGEWRAWTTPADEDGYRSRVGSLVEPALARWVHEGGATAASC